jgi:hypothetical protein
MTRWALAASAIGALAPAVATASNGTHVRTPVLWNDVACATVFDRSADPIFHLPYDIPAEDTDVTTDEVADSRTHQFVAFCRDNSPQDFIPNWVAEADVAAAEAKMLVEPGQVEAEAVLETNTEWQDCWFRINGDDERRPITFAMAAEGVDWDTSDVPAGVYKIHGYTWEPWPSLWTERPGFVMVVDDPDPAANAPGVAVSTPEQIIYRDQATMIEGCVVAMEGSTLTAAWARVLDAQPQWTAFVEDEPVLGDGFAVELQAPEALAGESGMVRIVVSDPMGRQTTAYMSDLVIVLAMDNPNSCEDGGGFIGAPACADSGTGASASDDADTGGGTEAGSTGAGSTAGDTGAPQDDDGGGNSGCGCHSDPRSAAWAWLILPAIAGARRPRQRQRMS